VAAAEASGYDLNTLYVTAIADGEYSGSVHDYLRDLPDCFINDQQETLDIIAPDGAARFTFLLLAGSFQRRDKAVKFPTPNPTDPLQLTTVPSGLASPINAPVAKAVKKLCADFAASGISTLTTATSPFKLHCSQLTRWDELTLRIMLHGAPHRATPAA
jgi:hypothetical protein